MAPAEMTPLGAWLLKKTSARLQSDALFHREIFDLIASFMTDRPDEYLNPQKVIQFAERLFQHDRTICKQMPDLHQPERMKLIGNKKRNRLTLSVLTRSKWFRFTAGRTFKYNFLPVTEGAVFFSMSTDSELRVVAEYRRPLNLREAVEILDNLGNHFEYDRCCKMFKPLPIELDGYHTGLVEHGTIVNVTRMPRRCTKPAVRGSFCLNCLEHQRIKKQGLYSCLRHVWD